MKEAKRKISSRKLQNQKLIADLLKKQKTQGKDSVSKINDSKEDSILDKISYEPRKFGYARVSSESQRDALEQQVTELVKSGIDLRRIFCDVGTGKNFFRENFQILQNSVRRGDVICVTRIDRFGRNVTESLILMKDFKEKGISVESLSTKDLGNGSPAARELIQNMFIVLAEYYNQEREELQRLGIERIRSNPELFKIKYSGRQTKLTPEIEEGILFHRKNGMKVEHICKLYDISIPSYYRYLKKMKNKNQI